MNAVDRIQPVSRVNKAAYALEKSSMALLWASTPAAKKAAQAEYDAACEDMRALLSPAKIKLSEAA